MILTMTMKRIESEQKQTYHRGRRPVTILVAVAAAIALLCGSVFAAYELNLFNFSRLFGENTEIIEDAVITYEPTSTEAVPATGGYAARNHDTAEDYNFTLLGEVTASAKLLYATIDVSRVSEDVPVFADSGLTLGIDGYEARTFYRGVGMTDRIVVYATLDEPLTEGATLDFTLTGPGGNTVLLENTPVTISEANTVVFANPDPNAAYVLDTASLTHTDLTVTGHFQTVEADYATALDASGTIAVASIPWPLYDRPIEEYDPEDGEYHEDMEGYLVLRDVQNDGTFTLEWTFVKNYVDFGTVTFCGVDYEIPEIEQEIVLEEYVPTFATSAETQDYRS